MIRIPENKVLCLNFQTNIVKLAINLYGLNYAYRNLSKVQNHSYSKKLAARSGSQKAPYNNLKL